jgi:hypothetical protein
MSKKSFNDIEQAIKTAAEAHEPAFDEQSWKKMEALLDKDKDRKRPIIFWMWWLLPFLIGAGTISYFVFNNNAADQEQKNIAAQKNENTIVAQQYENTSAENKSNGNIGINDGAKPNTGINSTSNKPQPASVKNNNKINTDVPVSIKKKLINPEVSNSNQQSNDEVLASKRKLRDKSNGKMKANITPANPESDNDNNETVAADNPDTEKSKTPESVKTEEMMVIKVDATKTTDKEIEKVIDSIVEKLSSDKKSKNKITRLYIIAATGAEGSGVKLFSAGKITGRAGLGVGYQINNHISIQTGFYVSSKKYRAAGTDYKTKPGTYWNIVNIKTIDANCRVYEIPLSVVYNFTPDKKLNIFASAGLSSYIMKKEDYYFYYDRYGTAHKAEVNYKGNKSLFSVLRLSAGIEKKISGRFSIFASPGVAIPLAGIGEGEVKLYSADITIGIKYFPLQKK